MSELGVGSRGSGVGARSEAESSDTRLPTPDTRNWRLLYAAVITELAVLIVIFYAFTKAFA